MFPDSSPIDWEGGCCDVTIDKFNAWFTRCLRSTKPRPPKCLIMQLSAIFWSEQSGLLKSTKNIRNIFCELPSLPRTIVAITEESELVPCSNGEEMVGEQLVTSWKYLWKITNFNSLSSVRCLLIYPKGNRTNSLALYLSVANPTGLPDGWSRFALFKLTLVNQINPGSSKRKGMNCLLQGLLFPRLDGSFI